MNRTLKEAVKLAQGNPYKHVLEFGVYKGGTIRQLRQDLDDSYQLHGFDSFEGLPEDWVGTTARKGQMSTGGAIPNIEGVTFYKGWFTDTIPEYLKVADDISILHADADLYSSTIQILYGLKDYIKSGTIIVFDEWYYNHKDIPENRQHEQKAFFEWKNEFNIEYELFPRIEDERQIVIIK